MKEIIGNVFDLAMEPGVDSICITTNGIVNASGLAIMGAGVAGEASKRWPTLIFSSITNLPPLRERSFV